MRCIGMQLMEADNSEAICGVNYVHHHTWGTEVQAKAVLSTIFTEKCSYTLYRSFIYELQI